MIDEILTRAELRIGSMGPDSRHRRRLESAVGELRRRIAASARDPFRESVERRRGKREIDWQAEVTEAARALSLLLDQG